MRTIISRNCDESTNSIETEPHDQQKKTKNLVADRPSS